MGRRTCPEPDSRGTRPTATDSRVILSLLAAPHREVVPGKVNAMISTFEAVLISTTLLSIVALSTTPSVAQTACGKRADVIRQLDEKYGETSRSLGLAQGRGVVEVYASEETGSWTILLTNPQGTSCLIAAGEAFQIDPVAGTGNPA